jgi:hypothetical protein
MNKNSVEINAHTDKSMSIGSIKIPWNRTLDALLKSRGTLTEHRATKFHCNTKSEEVSNTERVDSRFS